MKIIKSYRKVSPFIRVVVALLITILATTYAIRANFDPYLVAGCTVGGLIFLEILLGHTHKFFTSLLTLIITGAVLLYSYALFESFVTLGGDTVPSLAQAAGTAVVGVVYIIFAFLACYKVAKGRLWLNLLISYSIYVLTIYFMALSGWELSPIFYGMFAFIPLCMFVLITAIVKGRHHKEFDTKLLPKGKKHTIFLDKFMKETNYLTPVRGLGESEEIILLRNRRTLFYILPVIPERYFNIVENEAYVDGNTVTGLFEYLLDDAKKFSKRNRVKQTHIVPIVLTANSKLSQNIITLNIRRTDKREDKLGTILVVKSEKFKAITQQFDKMKEFSINEFTALLNAK